MVKGAAKTAMLIMAHIHPTKETLLEPLTASRETIMTSPKPPALNRRINLIVKI